MAGGLRELTEVLRDNGRKREEENQGEGKTVEEGRTDTRERERNGRASSPEEHKPSSFFNDWTSKKERCHRQNHLTLSFKSAKASLCEVVNKNAEGSPAKVVRQPSPAITLPSQLGSVQLTPTPTPSTLTPHRELELAMLGAEQGASGGGEDEEKGGRDQSRRLHR